MELVWIQPPDKLQKAIELYGRRVVMAILAGAQYIATKAEADMRQQAKWTDRTGNARAGLTSKAVGGGARDQGRFTSQNSVIIYFIHKVEYGIFLELSYGGRYSIIIPTMQKSIPEVEKMLQKIFN